MVLPTPLQAFSGMPKAAATTEKQTIVDGEKMTGAEALVRSLEDLGVQDVFGVPGGAILPVYDAINDETSFRFVLMRHEQAAGHAAEGYAVSTGQVGVCIVTSGPGATNMITPIADANMDSVPMVVITGQVGVNAIGTDGRSRKPISSAQPTRWSSTPIWSRVRRTFRACWLKRTMWHVPAAPARWWLTSPKPHRPAILYYSWPQQHDSARLQPHLRRLTAVCFPTLRSCSSSRTVRCCMWAAARHVPMPASSCRSWRKSRTLRSSPRCPHAVLCLIPIRRCIGMLGMHGTIAATGAVQRCDLLVAIGARFDDRVTGKLDAFAPGARVIHIDIDPAEIGKNRQPDVPIVGDVATVLKDLIPEIKREQAVHGKPDTSHWWEIINDWREKYPIKWDEPTDGSLAPQWVIKQLSDLADPDTIWVTGVGQHQMWATQLHRFREAAFLAELRRPRHHGLRTAGRHRRSCRFRTFP